MIAAGFVLILLVFMATASASPAGSSTNPLISMSYLSGSYSSALQTEIRDTLGGAADRAIGRLNEIYGDNIGYDFAPRFTSVALMAGDTVSLTTGSSFTLLSGSASISVSRGTVINITTGSEVASDSQLALYQRYFCAEETSALVTVGSASTGLLDGYYLLEGSGFAAPQLPFTDVPVGAWFFPAIDFVFKNQLFAGTTSTTFSPGTAMSRGMFVTVLHRLDGRPEAGPGGVFLDVADPSIYYFDAVTWANANGIVRGYEDGSFQPARPVTRQEMAAIMHRYATFKDRNTSTTSTVFDSFPDRGQVSEFAVGAMRWATSMEIIRGSSDGRLLPLNTATRAEVAQIILNYCEKVGR